MQTSRSSLVGWFSGRDEPSRSRPSSIFFRQCYIYVMDAMVFMVVFVVWSDDFLDVIWSHVAESCHQFSSGNGVNTMVFMVVFRMVGWFSGWDESSRGGARVIHFHQTMLYLWLCLEWSDDFLDGMSRHVAELVSPIFIRGEDICNQYSGLLIFFKWLVHKIFYLLFYNLPHFVVMGCQFLLCVCHYLKNQQKSGQYSMQGLI
jgi:hypothetical protein